jgi:hypothetical protein
MGRSPATFQKRQREVARRERQQLKAERRAQRKSEGGLTKDDDIDVENMTPLDQPAPTEA